MFGAFAWTFVSGRFSFLAVDAITDRYTGRPRGFAFVEMGNDEGANAAIAALNGQEVDGRALKVAPA